MYDDIFIQVAQKQKRGYYNKVEQKAKKGKIET